MGVPWDSRNHDLALEQVSVSQFNVVRNRYGPAGHRLDIVGRQELLDELRLEPQRILEKRLVMTNTNLGGDHAFTDEDRARKAYPYVCWEHPQLYPGLMVPNWAVQWRDACNRVGLSTFGRSLLEHLRRLFPKGDLTAEHEEKLQAAYEDGAGPEEMSEVEAACRREEEEATAKYNKGLETVAAALAVIELAYPSPPATASGTTLNTGVAMTNDEREALAVRILTVLEMGGMTYCAPDASAPSPHHKHLSREDRIRLNYITARDIEVSKLLVASRAGG